MYWNDTLERLRRWVPEIFTTLETLMLGIVLLVRKIFTALNVFTWILLFIFDLACLPMALYGIIKLSLDSDVNNIISPLQLTRGYLLLLTFACTSLALLSLPRPSMLYVVLISAGSALLAETPPLLVLAGYIKVNFIQTMVLVKTLLSLYGLLLSASRDNSRTRDGTSGTKVTYNYVMVTLFLGYLLLAVTYIWELFTVELEWSKVLIAVIALVTAIWQAWKLWPRRQNEMDPVRRANQFTKPHCMRLVSSLLGIVEELYRLELNCTDCTDWGEKWQRLASVMSEQGITPLLLVPGLAALLQCSRILGYCIWRFQMYRQGSHVTYSKPWNDMEVMIYILAGRWFINIYGDK